MNNKMNEEVSIEELEKLAIFDVTTRLESMAYFLIYLCLLT